MAAHQSSRYAPDPGLASSQPPVLEWSPPPGDSFRLRPEEGYSVHDDELARLGDLADPARVMTRLSAVHWAFTHEDTGYLSHDVHPYPAKFIPQIPRNLIARLSLRGELVYDPFGGCGTTALEAILLGRRALSTDVHPLAKIIGEAKTITLTKEEDDQAVQLTQSLLLLSKERALLAVELQQHDGKYQHYIPPIPNIAEWFHQNAINELAYLRWRIQTLSSAKVKTLAKVSFSKSVIKASFQDEETRYARKPREVPQGAVIRLFAVNLGSALNKVRQLGPLLQFREARFHTLDLRTAPVIGTGEFDGNVLARDSTDLVVTSPPYPNTTDYHLYHRFRLFWLGFDPRELAKREIGSHLRHQKERTGFDHYLREMGLCIEKVYEILRPGRYAAIVLGDGIYGGRVYKTPEELARVAKRIGFELVGMIERPVHATKRSFISSARRVQSEKVVMLRKPPASLCMELHGPSYKMWPYEEDLRAREATAVTGVCPTSDPSGTLHLHLDSLSVDRLRRLTFTSAFGSDHLSEEPTWQAILENGHAGTSVAKRKDPKYATHGIHPYKGKFYPQLAKSLFNLAGLEPGCKVIDPFCGSGTVLLEGYLNGLSAAGMDVNPLAIKIARVKVGLLEIDPYVRDRYLAEFASRVRACQQTGDPSSVFEGDALGELEKWFPGPVLRKIAWLLEEIQQIPEPRIRECLEVILSSLVRDVSHQEPRDLRIRRRKVPLRDAPVYEVLSSRLNEIRRRLQHFSERAKFAPNLFLPAVPVWGDSRRFDAFTQHGMGEEAFDAAVTSPPYATALPYIDTDRLSILLLFGLRSKDRSTLEQSLIGNREITKTKRSGLEALIDRNNFEGIRSKLACSIVADVRTRNRDSKAGFRRQNMAALLYLYFRDMSTVLENIHRLLRKGGSAFFVIGNNRTLAGSKEIQIESARAVVEIGLSLGWVLADEIPITVTRENRLHIKNSITDNVVVWFRKLP